MFQATQSLVPIVVLLVLGAFLFKKQFVTSEVRCGLDWFTYWVALPSLFISELSSTDFRALEVSMLVKVMIVSAVLIALLAAIVAGLMGVKRRNFGVFVQAGFRGNIAFVGLPLIIFAMESGRGGDNGELVAVALVTLAAMVPVTNMISVLALVVAQYRFQWAVMPRLLVQLISNPLIVSAVIGGGLGWMGWVLPEIVDRPFALLGQTALALALVSLGGALIELDVRGNIELALGVGIFKVSVAPVVTYLVAVMCGLSADHTLVAMIFAACPTATASYILTTQLGGNNALAAASVVVSTGLSLISLALVLMWF